MRVLIDTSCSQANDLREVAARRVDFVLRRLNWLVATVRVRFADENGPRGGIDKRCRIELATPGKPTVVATSKASEWRGAFELALARAARTLRKGHHRARRPARGGRDGALPTQDSTALT
jgi:ribosome-associated translation inhibitor RaiA